MASGVPGAGDKADKGLKVVLGVDYSETGELALERALELVTEEPHAELHLVHALRPTAKPSSVFLVLDAHLINQARERLMEHGQRAIDRFLLGHPERIGQSVRMLCHVRISEPAREIVRVIEKVDADLVVLGTHARRGLARAALGSVAEEVVRLSPCNVLVVRPSPEEATDVRDSVQPGQSLQSR